MRAPVSGLVVRVALAQRHEAGHLDLGELDLLAPELGEGEVGDLEVGGLGRARRIDRWSSWNRLLHHGRAGHPMPRCGHRHGKSRPGSPDDSLKARPVIQGSGREPRPAPCAPWKALADGPRAPHHRRRRAGRLPRGGHDRLRHDDPRRERRVPRAPPDRRTAALVVRDGDTIVRTAGSFPFRLTVPGGARVPMAAVTMVTVHPTHRRRGVLRQMMDEQLDDVARRGEPARRCSPRRRRRSTSASATAPRPSPPRGSSSRSTRPRRPPADDGGTGAPRRGRRGHGRRARRCTTRVAAGRVGELDRPAEWWPPRSSRPGPAAQRFFTAVHEGPDGQARRVRALRARHRSGPTASRLDASRDRAPGRRRGRRGRDVDLPLRHRPGGDGDRGRPAGRRPAALATPRRAPAARPPAARSPLGADRRRRRGAVGAHLREPTTPSWSS